MGPTGIGEAFEEEAPLPALPSCLMAGPGGLEGSGCRWSWCRAVWPVSCHPAQGMEQCLPRCFCTRETGMTDSLPHRTIGLQQNAAAPAASARRAVGQKRLCFLTRVPSALDPISDGPSASTHGLA